jgi:hypothetical protein
MAFVTSARGDGSLVAATHVQDLRFQAKDLLADANQPPASVVVAKSGRAHLETAREWSKRVGPT